MKTATIQNCSIARYLEAGNKIKLRSSTIYLDAERQTIWLRPRGLILFQIPQTVAALKLDALGKSVIEKQVRFSSGFPFVMIVFLWTAYRFFSVAMPADSPFPSAAPVPLPALFVGFAALMFLIGGLFSLRMYLSRMEKLVGDALAELSARS